MVSSEQKTVSIVFRSELTAADEPTASVPLNETPPASDGAYFTKFGARKLAHYVAREIEHIVGKQEHAAGARFGPASAENARLLCR
jgi:hypothetical protein